eukprot:SAG11_NODE_129_length_15500_cov_16.145250_5_plen_152_part_00
MLLYLCIFGALLFMIENEVQKCGHPPDGSPPSAYTEDECIQMNGRYMADRGGFTSIPTVHRTSSLSVHPFELQMRTLFYNTTCFCDYDWRIVQTWYFILATITTVGYGDHFPITFLGKFITCICMFCGAHASSLPRYGCNTLVDRMLDGFQ